MIIRRASALVLAALLGTAAAPPPLSHMDDLAAKFGARPSIQAIALSPEGTAVLIIGPAKGAHATALVHEIATGKTTAVLDDHDTPVRLRSCRWKTEQRLICTLSASKFYDYTLAGVSRLLAIDRDGKNPYALEGSLVSLLPDDPEHVLVATGDENGAHVARIDVRRDWKREVEGAHDLARGFVADPHGHVRIMGLGVRDNQYSWRKEINWMGRREGDSTWRPIGTEDGLAATSFRIEGFDADDDHILVMKPKDGREALYRMSLSGKDADTLILANDKVDIDGVLRLGKYNRPVGAAYTLDASEAVYFDPAIERFARGLAKVLPGERVHVASESWDGRRRLVFAGSDSDPGVYYVYKTDTHELTPLLPARPQLAGRTAGPVSAITYPAADGTSIPAYLTLPPGRTDARGLPGMMLPHGGPQARDERGFDFLAQYFAACGYAVVQPNYRGSSGYGEKWFAKNGWQGWRTAMGDINAGAAWLVKQGVPADKLVIFGSYGGYAALQANVLDPKLYKAAVAVAPVTDLGLMRSDALQFTNSRIEREYIGSGPHVIEGSPARNAEKIAVPVLMFQGDRDLNVDIDQARRMDSALTHAGKPHQLIVYPGLDHQLDDGDARADMLRRSAIFLAKAIGVSPAADASAPR